LGCGGVEKGKKGWAGAVATNERGCWPPKTKRKQSKGEKNPKRNNNEEGDYKKKNLNRGPQARKSSQRRKIKHHTKQKQQFGGVGGRIGIPQKALYGEDDLKHHGGTAKERVKNYLESVPEEETPVPATGGDSQTKWPQNRGGGEGG